MSTVVCDGDITGEPPEPRPSWRDDWSLALVLGKEVTSPFSSFIQSVAFRKIEVLHSEA